MRNKFLILLMMICLNIFSFNLAEGREIIFVVNSGQNMNISDPFHSVQESIIWTAENLSSNDEIGIITFGEIPQVVQPLSKITDNHIENLKIRYQGNSDASAALLKALDILSKKFDSDKAIIFFTDGENLIDEASKNLIFVENIKAGLRQAQWLNIPVYIFSLRADVKPQNYHSYNWAQEIPLNYLDLMTAVRTVIHTDFQTPHLKILSENISDKNLAFEVPITAPNKLKIMLLTSSAGKAELKNFENSSRVKRKFLNVFELNAPTTNKFEMALNYPQGTGLTLDVIPTVSGILKTEISTPLFGENVLEITPIYSKNQAEKIFGDKFFDGKFVNLQINDKNFVGEIQGGTIKTSLNGIGEIVSLQKIHFENLGIIFDGNDAAQLKNPKNFLVWIIALAAILTILILSWLIQRKNISRANSSEKSPPLKNFLVKISDSKNSYSGKLIIRTENDEEFAPREFNLFRVTDAQISLSKILEECNISGFKNFSGIMIKPTAQGILIENDSTCTITKENILMAQNEKIELGYNDSIIISPEYENTALILTFESLKPN